MQKFQGGGAPVFGLDPNAGGQSYKPDNSQLFSVATMPLESGLNAYMGMQQLQGQRNQLELQKQDLAHKIEIDNKRQLLDDYKAQATIRDDFFKIDVLAQDAPRYQELLNEAIPPDLRERAARGDKGAMDEMIRRSTTLFMNPEINEIRGRQKQSEKAWKAYVDLPLEMKRHVRNSGDIINGNVSGGVIPNMDFDQEGYNKMLEDERISAEKDKEYKRNYQEALKLDLEQKTEKLKHDNYINEQMKIGTRAKSMKELNITGTYEEQTPENKAKIDAKGVEGELKVIELKNKLEETKIKAAEVENKINESKLKIFDEQLVKTGDPIAAGMASGITKMEVDELVKLKILQNSTTIEDAAAKIKDYETKNSNVNYHTDKNDPTGDYTQANKSSERVYRNHVRNATGDEINSVNINGEVIQNKKDSFPEGVSVFIKDGKPWVKVSKNSPEAKNWLKSKYNWQYEDTILWFDDNYNDFVNNKVKPGAKLVNGELLIPIEDESTPAQTKTTTTPTRTPVKPPVSKADLEKKWK